MPRRRFAVAAVAIAVLMTAGCHAGGSRQAGPGPSSAATSPAPRPTITVLRTTQTLAAGETGQLTAQAGVKLSVRASKPSVSRSRLSSSYGYGPAHGYYVTFVITIVNTGTAPVDIGPANFRVRIPGEGIVTTNDGNAPYSGASEQLDSTEIDPGQTIRGPVTYDVRRPHGVLSYLPDRTAAMSWRF